MEDSSQGAPPGISGATACGRNRQEDDSRRLMVGAIKQIKQKIQPHITGLKESDLFGNFMEIPFSKYSRFVEMAKFAFSLVQDMNPGHFLLSPNGTTPDWSEIITFDVYDAFGAAGHLSVHASVMLIFTNSKAEKETSFQVKLDLQAGDGDLVKSQHSPTSLLMSISSVSGVEEPWKYRMTCKMSFAKLFDSITKSLKKSMVWLF